MPPPPEPGAVPWPSTPEPLQASSLTRLMKQFLGTSLYKGSHLLQRDFQTLWVELS